MPLLYPGRLLKLTTIGLVLFAVSTLGIAIGAEITLSDQAIGPVNRAILGANILGYPAANQPPDNRDILFFSMKGGGFWNPETQRPVPEMLDLMREAGVTTLRWPGGCEAHEFNWKKTVGPLKNRPRQAFGLPEFLKLCEALKAEPIVTMADYWGNPEDFADLVEYLNAPATENPNGGIAWAKVRAQDGHAAPYGVKWFEAGNESFHGPHADQFREGPLPAILSADSYATRFLQISAAMKAVDPSVKVGAVLGYDLSPNWVGGWSETVLNKTAKDADFFIYHAYGGDAGKDGTDAPDKVYRRGFTTAREFEAALALVNLHIRKIAGREIPLAITEYNGGYAQDKPVPYRFALGTAVQVADFIQVLLQPSLNISQAHYWQFANEYWGMIKGDSAPYMKRPAWYLMHLYHTYLGDTLLAAKTESDSYDGAAPSQKPGATLTPRRTRAAGSPIPVTQPWEITPVDGVKATTGKDHSLTVEIANNGLDYYHAAIKIPAAPRSVYHVSADIRTENGEKSLAQIQVGDGRGWNQTQSAEESNGAQSSQWNRVDAWYTTLADSDSLVILARRFRGVRGPMKFQIRNVTVEEFEPVDLGSTPALATLVTRDSKTGDLYLIIVNRRLAGPTPLKINNAGKIQSATAEILSGPSVEATNESNPNTVTLRPLAIKMEKDHLALELPPHSVTGIRIKRGLANSSN